VEDYGMKREHKNIYPNLYRHFHLFFWTKCCGCEKDFVREKGWMTITIPHFMGSLKRQYLCSACAPSKAIASEFFDNKSFLKKRPPRPTAPPLRRA